MCSITDQIDGRRVVASISGGKDSAAMSLWLTEQGIDHDRVFIDTGWEHPATYDYLRGELTRVIGPITELRGELLMEDLIRKKGMFPSRQQRFCTQQLKVFPTQRYLASLDGDHINAVGIRAGESRARSHMSEWEWSKGFDCETWRPLIRWSEQDVFDAHARHGLKPNPLYLLGAQRVGCWPCLYARKAEIRMVADLTPERIDTMRDLETEVTDLAAARYAKKGETFESLGYSHPSWFQDPRPKKQPCRDCGGKGCDVCAHRGTRRYGGCMPIDKVVEWARGGDQRELFAAPYSEQGCMRWGLCETDYMTHAIDVVMSGGTT